MTQSVKQDVEVVRERTLAIRNLVTELTRIKDVPQLKSLADKAEALQIWAKRAKLGWEMAAQAGEIRLRAARRGGLILSTMKKGYGRGGESQYSKACDEAGMPQWQAALWQRVADIPEPEFESTLEVAREQKRPISLTRIVRGAQPQPPRGCVVSVRFDEEETKKLDKLRKDANMERDEFLVELLRSW